MDCFTRYCLPHLAWSSSPGSPAPARRYLPTTWPFILLKAGRLLG